MVDHLLLSAIDNALDILVLITIPIYIMVLITIVKNRKDEVLRHAFFDLMISIGVADIGKIIWTMMGSALARKGWWPQFFIWIGSDLSARMYLTGLFFFGGAQVLGTFVVGLNRFTAYALPVRHNGLWNQGRILRYCIVFQWLYATASGIPILISKKTFKINFAPDNKSITFAWEGANEYNFYNTLIVLQTLTVMAIVLYAVICGIVIKKQCRKEQGRGSQTEKLALRISLIGFIHCIGAIFSENVVVATLLAWIIFHYNLFADQVLFWFLVNLGQMLYAVVNPYTLLIFCTPVRRHFMMMYVQKHECCRGQRIDIHTLNEKDHEENVEE